MTGLRVITNDGRKGVLATPVLQANAFTPVEVRFADGQRKQYYLRELQVAQTSSVKRMKAGSSRP